MTTTTPPATAAPTNPQALAPRTEKEKAALTLGARGIETPTADELMRVADAMIQAGVTPKGDSKQTVFIKLLGGVEHGFTLTAALKVMCVVNGKLSIEGKGLLAIIRRSKVGRVAPGNGGEGENRYGFVDWERFDTQEKGRVTFTKSDARTAGLLSKTGDTYKNYLDDMLMWRAVSRCADRHFSDITLGLEPRESAETFDSPEVRVTSSEPSRPQLPPSAPDPLLIEAAPTSAETSVAQPEREPGEDCPHPEIPEARLAPGGLAPGEVIACTACGEEFRGPEPKPEPAKAPKGQGRIA